jgi:ABC-type transporter Mla MlaB component
MTSALANNLFQHSDLCWSGVATVEQVSILRQELLEALLQSQSVSIDLGEVTRLDLALLQLLCAAQRVAVPQGKQVQLQGMTHPPLAAAIENYGFLRQGPCCRDCGSHCLWLSSPGTQKKGNL